MLARTLSQMFGGSIVVSAGFLALLARVDGVPRCEPDVRSGNAFGVQLRCWLMKFEDVRG